MRTATLLVGAALLAGAAVLSGACGGSEGEERSPPSISAAGDSDVHVNTLLELWEEGVPAFGIYVPDERPRDEGTRVRGERPSPLYTVEGGARLAANPLYDFLFLDLEEAYDTEAVRLMEEGIHGSAGSGRKALLVRIPPISSDGVEAARARVREVLSFGADGVIFPHVRDAEEARTAIAFFEEAGADVWSPSNPDGHVIAMLMLEDPEAIAQVSEIARLPGYSVLACGISSLRRALDGDREAAETANQLVLAEATRAGLADMITASEETVAERVREGFLALLISGPAVDDVIRLGRGAATR